MNSHARRLQNALSEIRDRGHFTRLEPPQILIETRRLLESASRSEDFPVVGLYADWCAHSKLDRAGAAAVLLEITAALNRSIRDSSNASIDAVYGSVNSALGLGALKVQLGALYNQFNVDTWPFDDPQMFRQFMGAILDAIAELPLKYPPNASKKGGRVGQLYQKACHIARDDPKWIITECSVINELSNEQMTFYEVPEGTYLWQISTAANVSFCGVLHG
jgi:hypothetical protein